MALNFLPWLVQLVLIIRRFTDWTPVWAWYPDPGYQYLLTGGAITSGETPHHNDHPGTSFQWVVGVAERITYLFVGEGPSFSLDLVSRPETYAFGVGIFLAMLYIAALGFAGYRLFRSFGLVPSLVFQLTLLWGMPVLASGRYLLWPESLVITCGLILLGILTPLLARTRSSFSTNELVALGVVSGAGLTAKIIFLPLIAVALVLVGRRGLRTYLLALLATTALVLLTVYPRLGYMWGWFSGIATQPSRHGQETGAGTLETVAFSLAVLQGNVRWLGLVFAFLFAAGLILVIAIRSRNEDDFRRPFIALLVGISLVLVSSVKDAQARDFVLLVMLVASFAALTVTMLRIALTGRLRAFAGLVSVVFFAFLAAHGVVGNEYQYRFVKTQIADIQTRAALLNEAVDLHDSYMGYNVWTPRSALQYALLSTPFSFRDEFATSNVPAMHYDIFRNGLVGYRNDGKYDLLPCDEVREIVVNRPIQLVVENPTHLGMDASNRRVTLHDGYATVTEPSVEGTYHFYQIDDVTCGIEDATEE